ncbi:MAG: redox-regulated ATPase YchF [Acidilobaceae archaeon]
MEASSILVGIVGKTNTGKSTFFSAATEIDVPIENRPFVTIDPNIGVAYVKRKCVHLELGLIACNASNSICKSGWRFIPVKIIDVAGLVPGAHEGRGLGNMFLDHVRRADVLLLVIDASGSTDEEGRPVKPGSFDPIIEVKQMIYEFEEWMYSIIRKDWEKIARYIDTGGIQDSIGFITQRLSGLGVSRRHVAEAIQLSGLENKKLSSWTSSDLRRFTSSIRRVSKPIVIIANKADIDTAEDNIKRLRDEYKDIPVIPTSSVSELILRKSSSKGIIEYIPGDREFKIISKNTPRELSRILDKIADYMRKWGSTGVQEALNEAVFNQLSQIAVYPVEDHNKYTDKQGRILPDTILLPRGSTARDLAYRIHTELGETFIYAINAKTKQRIGESYILNDNDVIKIVAVAARKA